MLICFYIQMGLIVYKGLVRYKTKQLIPVKLLHSFLDVIRVFNHNLISLWISNYY